MGQIHKIQTPTFFLSCRDDPCIRPDLYPFKEFENNENVIAGFTERGGHCGAFTGGIRPIQWFPTPFIEFLEFMELRSIKNKK